LTSYKAIHRVGVVADTVSLYFVITIRFKTSSEQLRYASFRHDNCLNM